MIAQSQSASEMFKRSESKIQNDENSRKNTLSKAKTYTCKIIKGSGSYVPGPKELKYLTMLDNKIIMTNYKLTPSSLPSDDKWVPVDISNTKWIWEYKEKGIDLSSRDESGLGKEILKVVGKNEFVLSSRELFTVYFRGMVTDYAQYGCSSTSPLSP